MPEPTNLDAITTWCHTCGRPVSMPHEHGDAPPTPTVIESDRKIAEEWYRCGCGMTYETIMESGRPDGDHHHVADEVERMASEIAAAREAWGAELTAELQGLREVATSGPSTVTGPTPFDGPRSAVSAAKRAEAVAGLVGATGAWVAYMDSDDWQGNHDDEVRMLDAMRAALERAKGDGA